MEARAIVEIRLGRLQGKKAIIAPGGRLTVGRTDWADLVVPNDLQMSNKHFELEWDGARCTLRDLGSVKGTLLGGEPVKEAEVEHGAWIRAGQTDFGVHFEGWTPSLEEEEAADDEDEEEQEDEERAIRIERAAERATEQKARTEAAKKALVVLQAEAEKEKLYAVLDAARDERILQLLRQNVEEYRSLYEGIEGEMLAEVAPYLVGPIGKASRLLKALVCEGWGKRWAIYLTSHSAFTDVRRHLRRFLMVEDDETGERLYFRFYDPWVLAAFLSASTQRQRSAFFGESGIHQLFSEELGSVFSSTAVSGAGGEEQRC